MENSNQEIEELKKLINELSQRLHQVEDKSRNENDENNDMEEDGASDHQPDPSWQDLLGHAQKEPQVHCARVLCSLFATPPAVGAVECTHEKHANIRWATQNPTRTESQNRPAIDNDPAEIGGSDARIG